MKRITVENYASQGTMPTNKIIKTKFGDLKMYNRLKDVPDQEEAIIVGSSGIKDKRFLEFVIQGGSFAKKHNVSAGDLVL